MNPDIVAEIKNRQKEGIVVDPDVVAEKRLDVLLRVREQQVSMRARTRGYAVVGDQVLIEHFPSHDEYNEGLAAAVALRNQVAVELTNSGHNILELLDDPIVGAHSGEYWGRIVGMKVGIHR